LDNFVVIFTSFVPFCTLANPSGRPDNEVIVTWIVSHLSRLVPYHGNLEYGGEVTVKYM
jgi:hypothetical protein